MIKSLRKIGLSHPTGHYIREKKSPPLRKSWVRPCIVYTMIMTGHHESEEVCCVINMYVKAKLLLLNRKLLNKKYPGKY